MSNRDPDDTHDPEHEYMKTRLEFRDSTLLVVGGQNREPEDLIDDNAANIWLIKWLVVVVVVCGVGFWALGLF